MKLSRSIHRQIFITAALLFMMVLFFHIPSHAESELSDNPDIKISRTDAIMVKGQKMDLFLYDRNNIDMDEMRIFLIKGVSWASSNAKVASVNSSGVVKAKKTGNVTIRGTYGDKVCSCKIKVYKSLSSSKRQKLAQAEAKKIVRRYTNSSMSPQIKALVLAGYLNLNVYSQYDQSNSSYRKNFGNEAYASLIMHLSACSGNCKAYIMLCKAAGLKCKHVNAGQWRHQWNKVKLGGKWVKVDTQAGTFDYAFTDEEFEYYGTLAIDYDHLSVIYRKTKNGMKI